MASTYWDGNIAGQPASSNQFVSLIEVECSNGNRAPRVGEVTLLR